MSDKDLVSRVNPSVKVFLHLLAMVYLIATDDLCTTLGLLMIPVFLVLFVVRVPLKTFLWRISPFLLMFLSTVWVFTAYGKGETVYAEWGWYRITEEGLMHGLTVGCRMLAFVSYGYLFTATTEITAFVLSLMQQCKVPPKFAYAMLAGFRFLPMFRDEYEQIKAAHRVRGVARVPGVRGRVQAMMRYTVPLLAQGIRKADRVAVALEARGFDGSRERTFYRQLTIGKSDGLYAALLIVLNTVVFWLL
jgi:energy-coupling factor transport system permease protein